MKAWLLERGGKRGLLHAALTPVLVTVTPWKSLSQPVDGRARRAVFVCAGNICRSPFAEQLARNMGLNAASMGLRADPGTPANPQAALHARAYGVDLAGHRARQVEASVLQEGDLLLGFELWHGRALVQQAPPALTQVRLLGAFSSRLQTHIFDPYGQPEATFRYCFDRIHAAVSALARSTPSLRGAAPS